MLYSCVIISSFIFSWLMKKWENVKESLKQKILVSYCFNKENIESLKKNVFTVKYL